MTTAKRQALAEFIDYGICTGQREIGPIGYAPLPPNLVQLAFDAVDELNQADPAVDLTGLDLADCTGNPAFDPTDPGSDPLITTSTPYPAACERDGAAPCPITTTTLVGADPSK